MPYGATGEAPGSGQETKDRSEGKAKARALIGVSTGKTRRDGVNSLPLASLSDSSRLWAVGLRSSCLGGLGQGKYWLGV